MLVAFQVFRGGVLAIYYEFRWLRRNLGNHPPPTTRSCAPQRAPHSCVQSSTPRILGCFCSGSLVDFRRRSELQGLRAQPRPREVFAPQLAALALVQEKLDLPAVLLAPRGAPRCLEVLAAKGGRLPRTVVFGADPEQVRGEDTAPSNTLEGQASRTRYSRCSKVIY